MMDGSTFYRFLCMRHLLRGGGFSCDDKDVDNYHVTNLL
jgi:hypothetical protein